VEEVQVEKVLFQPLQVQLILEVAEVELQVEVQLVEVLVW
jgi:hypothetical protein